MSLAEADSASCGASTLNDILMSIRQWPEQDRLYGGPAVKGFDIGVVNRDGVPCLSEVDMLFPSLCRRIVDFCRRQIETVGSPVVFNSIQVSYNHAQRRLGREKGGLCAFIGIGSYTGGELQVGTEYFVTLNRVVVFDSGEMHAHKYSRGSRFGLLCAMRPGAKSIAHELSIYPTECIPRGIAVPMHVSILSKDLGCFNTFVTTQHGLVELPYKRQGIWALKLEDDFRITERLLVDTYFEQKPFITKEWDTTIYTVSDTACATSRPLACQFYEEFVRNHGLHIPRIEYRTPFLILISRRWGNAVLLGNRRLPFYSSLYFYEHLLQICSSTTMHSTAEGVLFD